MSCKITDNKIINLLKNISNDDLISFIANHAESDERLRSEIISTFGIPNVNEEMRKIKSQISIATREGTRSGFIDYGGCIHVCRKFDEIIEEGERRFEQGHLILAFSIALSVLLKTVWLISNADDSSGCASSVFDGCLRLIDKVCISVKSENDQKFVYEKCLKEAKNKVFDGWDQWNYSILRRCAKLVTKKNKNKIFETLEYLETKGRKSDYYSEKDDRLTRLEICKHLEGETEYEKQIDANLDLDEVRKIAINRANEKGDFMRSERLCLEKLKNDEKIYYHWWNQWYEILFDIYVRSENKEKQIELAKKLLFDRQDIRYFETLKNLLIQNGTWNSEYEAILNKCAKVLPSISYMHLLDKENENELLFEEVKKYPETILKYGKMLSLYYPNEIIDIFVNVIKKQALEVKDRKGYKKLCANIKLLFESGGHHEAYVLIKNLLDSNKRRPAMMDELQKLQKRLEKIKE